MQKKILSPLTMQASKRALALSLSMVFMGAALCSNVLAQTWPSKPVKVIVNFPPGGAADQIARAIGIPLAEALGQAVVVENRGGANGNLGGEAVAKSAADGYTLLMGTVGTHGINRALYAKLPYDPFKDFAPITLVAGVPNVMVVNAEKAAANRNIGSEALEAIRRQMVDWRSALLGEQNANAARIATLRAQIAALGPSPGEGVPEVEEIAQRRAVLTEQLVTLQAPALRQKRPIVARMA